MSQKYKNFFPVRHDAAGNLAAMYLPNSARWLYIVLCQLDNRFCRPTRDFFFRSLNDLEKDTGMNRKTIIKAKKIGRNDPCPCGSGKKYKKCCYPKYE